MWERDEIKQEKHLQEGLGKCPFHPHPHSTPLFHRLSQDNELKEKQTVSFKTSIREISVHWQLISLVLVQSLESRVGEIWGPGLLFSLSQAVFQIKISPEVNYGLSHYEHHWDLICINLPILWLCFSLFSDERERLMIFCFWLFIFIYIHIYIFIYIYFMYIYIYVFSVSDFIYIHT